MRQNGTKGTKEIKWDKMGWKRWNKSIKGWNEEKKRIIRKKRWKGDKRKIKIF